MRSSKLDTIFINKYQDISKTNTQHDIYGTLYKGVVMHHGDYNKTTSQSRNTHHGINDTSILKKRLGGGKGIF